MRSRAASGRPSAGRSGAALPYRPLSCPSSSPQEPTRAFRPRRFHHDLKEDEMFKTLQKGLVAFAVLAAVAFGASAVSGAASSSSGSSGSSGSASSQGSTAQAPQTAPPVDPAKV